MFEQNSEDFLWFVNYGITKGNAESNHGNALECCIESAYKDACRHIRYYYSLSDLDVMKRKTSTKEDQDRAKDFEKKKNDFIKQCNSIIKNNIEELLSNSNADFDKWHQNLCTGEGDSNHHLSDIPDGLFENGSTGLTIGQRQKWINMSIKNMLIMGFWDEALSKYKDVIHVPIDDKILTKAKEEGINTILPKEWNNINDYDEYMRFQTELRDKLKPTLPIVWEWDAWMR